MMRGDKERVSNTEDVAASELAEWAYCRRAWWYARQGLPREARPQLAAGTAGHAAIAQQVHRIERQRAVAVRLFVGGLTLTVLLVALLGVVR